VAVQASRWEGFGVAILEALSLGVPQIATDCPGGISEVLGHGEYGLLVPPDSAAELAVAIGRLASDKQLRKTLAERGPTRAAMYAPARVAAQMVALACEIRDETRRRVDGSM
jgi:glycosyltransferase involved in cell wall biosynthesis